MAEFRSRGLFWFWEAPLPGNLIAPSSSVAGELSIGDDGRIELTLDGFLDRGDGRGAWSVMPSKAEDEAMRSRFVEGRLTRENRQVFLYGLSRGRGSAWRSSGISTEGLGAERCLISRDWGIKGLPSAAATLTLDLTDLLGWVRFEPFLIDRKARTIALRTFEARSFETTVGVITIDASSTATHPMLYTRDGRFDAEARLTLEGRDEWDLEEVGRLFRLFQELFILLCDSEHSLPFPVIEVAQDGIKHEFTYYCGRLHSDAPSPDWWSFPTNLADLGADFARIVDAWFEKRETFGPGFYLYLGLRRGVSLYTENMFWSLVTGFESFHSTKFPSSENRKLREKLDRILTHVPAGRDRTWLGKVLSREIAPRLHERILDILMSLPLDLAWKEASQFAQSCAKLRNDLAHFGGHRSGGYSTFIESLHRKINAMRPMYHALILLEIGVPVDHVTRWFFEGYTSFLRKEALEASGLSHHAVFPVLAAKD